MLNLTRASLFFAVGLTLSVSGIDAAFALDPQVESTLTGNIVQVVSGKEVFASADKAGPGDVIEYKDHLLNKDKGAVSGLLATIPVPDGTEYIAGSAHPAPTQASADGKTFGPLPLKRIVKAADGRQREEAVPATEYRAVRWDLGALAAGKDATVSLRVKVSSTPPKAPAQEKSK